jgi:hypothetical protein
MNRSGTLCFLLLPIEREALLHISLVVNNEMASFVRDCYMSLSIDFIDKQKR